MIGALGTVPKRLPKYIASLGIPDVIRWLQTGSSFEYAANTEEYTQYLIILFDCNAFQLEGWVGGGNSY